MNKLVLLFILSFVLSFLYSCSKTSSKNTSSDQFITNPEYGTWQDQETPPIKFELVQTFGEENSNEDELLINITSMFVDDDQNVYVLDPRSTKLISYSKSGDVRWIIDSAGKGPGDLSEPTAITWNKSDLIYLSNLNGNRTDVFNLNGKFIETLNLPDIKEPLELIGYSDGKLIFASIIRGAFAKKFWVLDLKDLSSFQTSFIIDKTGKLEIPVISNWFPKTTVLDGDLVYGGVSEYEYSYVGLDSSKGKVIKRDFDKIVRPGFFEDDEGSIIGALGGMNALLKLSNDYYISSANWPIGVDDPDAFLEGLYMGTITEFKLGNTIDLFDKNMTLLYSIEGEEAEHSEYGTPRYIDSKGFLYSTFTAPYAHIKKFRIAVVN